MAPFCHHVVPSMPLMCLVKKIAQHCKAQHNVCDHTGWWANPAHQGSTWVSRILGGPGQKLTRTNICKKYSTQSGPNLWWVGLTHGF